MTASPDSIAERLKDVRVGVRPELDVSRHLFSGVPAYVVRDPITFQSHRIGPADYQVFVAINAKEKLGRTFERLCECGVTSKSQEEEFYRYVISLNQRGLLSLPVSDGSQLYTRFSKRQQAKRNRGLSGLLFLRVPLTQPDQFLERTRAWVRPLFTWTALAVWCLAVLVAVLIVHARWADFQSPLANVLTAQNLPLVWCLLVGLKVVHELGHAYACKHFGGSVPEIGAYFILFTPCAYVDASASWGFENRWHRVAVALAGMYFESLVAMVAVVVWCLTGPGLVHDAAHCTVIFSTVVTVGFNINPLMKYDGYYVLSDLIGMPNLRSEALAQIRSSLVRVLYGVKRPRLAEGIGRRCFLATFGLASSLYKLVVLGGISLLIAIQLPLVGISLAVYYLATSIWQSGQEWFLYLRYAEELNDRRRQAVAITGLVLGTSVLLTTCLELPTTIESVGVVQTSDETVVRAGVDGFLAESNVHGGDSIAEGQLVCRLENDEILAERQDAVAQSRRLDIAWRSQLAGDHEAADASRKRWGQAEQRRLAAERKYRQLEVTSNAPGRVLDGEPLRHPGRFFRRGEPLATVGTGPWQVAVLLTAEQFAETRLRDGATVRLQLIGRPGVTLQGRVTRIGGGGSSIVADETFTQLAGGRIAVDAESMETSEPLFEVRIELTDVATTLRESLRRGMTTVVLFDGQRSSIAGHLYRRGLNLLNQLRLAS